tara:strand:+ start:9245 stop:11491 length:2247 start_codon:yes stop_codon:yes gene_type:complete
MKKTFYKFFLFLILTFLPFNLQAEILKKVEVYGNERIVKETIIVYGDIKENKDYTQEDIDNIVKNLYETKFFSSVSINFSNGVLKITVVENPIINSILIQGEPTKKYVTAILELLSLKEKASYIKSEVKRDLEIIKSFYKSLGYYSPEVDARIQEVEGGKNLLNLVFAVDRGKREKISKIYFIGDKKVKTKRLRDVIASEEARFWKVISNNVYLNSDRIELDKRLLKRYYLGKGYYDVQILSSNVFLKEKEGIELTFSINAGKRYRIKKLSTDIQPVFDKSIFKPLQSDFKKYAGEYYSPFKVTKILENIDEIIDENELQFVQHSVSETIDGDFIDIEFKIYEGRKVQIERVNIIGNTVTNDSVIRSELLLDEGDPFSNIKLEKSISNLKARGLFKTVKKRLLDGSSKDLKVMEIVVEEKPTGEISAGAGTGTDGTTFSFALKENNYLGKGLTVDSSLELTEHSIRGGVEVVNPNYNYTGNSVNSNIFSKKTDNPDSGFENTLTSLGIGTRFEQYKNVYLGSHIELAFDDVKVDSTASSALKKQEGSFTDLTFSYGVDKDTRDRRFMPTSGSITTFSQGLPIYSEEQASIFNRFSLSKYHGFSDDVIGAIKFYAAGVTALEDDVRLSKRLHVPSRRLRGFESKKIGPKDGVDYVGGNYAAALNFEAALPNLLPETTQTDIAVFFDAANLWHADYDSSVGQSSKIRSSVGVATNMYTLVGPLNFVFAKPLTKVDSDSTQTFKFEIGTSF